MSASTLQKLLLAVGTSALCVVGAELVQRTRTGWDRGEAELRLTTLRDEALGRWGAQSGTPESDDSAGEPTGRAWSVSPYVGFDFENAGDLMTRDLARQAASTGEEFRILVLGGSVAANFAFLGKERLIETLRRDPRLADRSIEFFMYARPSHKQPQQLLAASVLLSAGLQPDLVLNLDGFNELAIASRNAELGVHPLQPTAGQWLPLLEGTRRPETLALTARAFAARERLIEEVEAALESPRLSSALLGPGVVARVQQQRARLVTASDALVAAAASGEGVPPALTGPAVPPAAERLGTCVDLWRESSRSLAGLCTAHGIPYLHVLQPTLHDAGSKPLTDAERESSKGPQVWIAAARLGYPRLRAAGAELRDAGVAFFDGSAVFAELQDPVYYDVCHFRRPGHELLAEAIAGAILSELP